MTYNLVELLIEHKFADNVFRAAAIVNGLKLWELSTEAEQLARVRLYRDWRVSKIYGSKTAPCFEEAIKGTPVPVKNIFEDIEKQMRKELGFDVDVEVEIK